MLDFDRISYLLLKHINKHHRGVKYRFSLNNDLPEIVVSRLINKNHRIHTMQLNTLANVLMAAGIRVYVAGDDEIVTISKKEDQTNNKTDK